MLGPVTAPAFLEIPDAATGARQIPLTGAGVMLGADAACDVVLPGLAARHARLEVVAGAHHVRAEGDSAVRLGDAVIAADVPLVLHDGDVLQLGALVVVYRNPLASRIAAVQHFATPPGTALLTIGRAGADIVLEQALVARHHADLAWEGGHHVLRDRASANGTWVNGTRLRGERVLARGDVVQIGTFRLTYDGDSLDSYDQRGAIRIDATAIERRVGGRALLTPTTLSIEPCEFVAIVGGSGAGKSTLMTALCGFNRATGGTVTLNGDDLYANYDAYRAVIGFVPQDDILHRALTVARALHHAAQLRLPADTSPAEIAARITAVLAAVEMSAHADKRIEDLSGGQRKRVSIACELLADPVLLFLDEPTSGLDPGLERKLMQTLRKLADGGRTIVLVTHATQNLGLCDHVAFVAAGQVVYFGPPAQALTHFGVADMADVYGLTDDALAVEAWVERYRGSLQYQAYAVDRPARAPAAPTSGQRVAAVAGRRGPAQSRARQLQILCRRYAELVLADRRNLMLLLLQAPVIGLLLAMVSRTDGLTESRLEAKKLIFMLATTGVWFGVINSAREICKEAHVLRRERLAGLHVGPYVGSKLIVLAALVLIQSAVLLAVVAARTTLPARGVLLPPVLELYVTIALAGLAGTGLGLCLSAVATTPDKATSLIPIVLVPQVVFAGIMFALHGPTEVLSMAVAARAAVDALSATIDTNALSTPINLIPAEPRYAPVAATVLVAWGALVAQMLAFTTLAWWALRRRA